MSGRARILGAGCVDATGIVGSRGTSVAWGDLDQDAPGTGRTMREVFDKADATFRRLDLPSRAMVLACEAADVGGVLTDAQRQQAALFVDTRSGSLASDRKFASSLGGEMVAAGVFPFTLPSTTLGEVALRYGLRGPTISWSVEIAPLTESVAEALRQFSSGEIEHAVIGAVDVVPEAPGSHDAMLRALVAVLACDPNGELAVDAPDLEERLLAHCGGGRA